MAYLVKNFSANGNVAVRPPPRLNPRVNERGILTSGNVAVTPPPRINPKIKRGKTVRQIQELKALHDSVHEHLSAKPQKQKIRGGGSCCAHLVNDHAAKHAATQAVREEWKHKLAHRLHSRKMHTAASVLLLIDVLIVFVDLFIEAQFPHCFYVKPNAWSCCPSTNATDTGTHHRRLSQAPACDPGYIKGEATVGCDAHRHEWLHPLHYGMVGVSILILSFFLVENCLTMLANGCKYFWSHPLYVLDLFVVVASLSSEVGVLALKADALHLGAMLILLRVWRFLRIGHGIGMTQQHAGHGKRDKKLKEMYAQLSEKLHHFIDNIEQDLCPISPEESYQRLDVVKGFLDDIDEEISHKNIKKKQPHGKKIGIRTRPTDVNRPCACPNLDPNPDPNPNPNPDPNPDAEADPDPNPNLDSTPDAEADPSPNPSPNPNLDPSPDPNPSPNPDPNPDAEADPSPNPNPDPNPDADPNPIPNSDPNPEADPNRHDHTVTDEGEGQVDVYASEDEGEVGVRVSDLPPSPPLN